MAKNLQSVEKTNEVINVQKEETVKDILIEDLSTNDALYEFTRGLIPQTFEKIKKN